MDVIADLAAEQERIETLLGALDDEAWSTPSAAPGWTITDVVIHLAQTEEAVAATIHESARPGMWDRGDLALDDAVAQAVAADRDEPARVFERWRTARRRALAALRDADPDRRVQWAAAPLRPQVLATTRLAEHWAHGLDITQPLRLPFPDTDRLRHIAWLGHRTLPYAFEVNGLEPQPVFCSLTGPGGDTWEYGDPSVESRIEGPAGDFCRVGARRLTPEQTALVASGPHAAMALRVLRNYAV
ncbi:MAG: maleylpyruvate isomerase family mycothiol-dependent enzyme [Frankiales bacterium]|nr:maleylpyruvate isomerase family mycothiol-dependent enzyme [Frankiales bacterium]